MWSGFSIFLLVLLLIAIILAVLTYSLNEFEKSTSSFIERLSTRYSPEKAKEKSEDID